MIKVYCDLRERTNHRDKEMTKALFAVIFVLAIWLALASLFLGYPAGITRWLDTGTGVAGTFLALWGWVRPKARWLGWLIGMLGLILIVSAAWGWAAAATGYRANELLLGILWVLFGVLTTQVFYFPSVAAVDKYGGMLTEILAIQCKGDDLTIKANILTTIPATIYVHPEELWKALGMIDSGVIARLPTLLVKGWWRTRRLAKASAVRSKSAELTSLKMGR